MQATPMRPVPGAFMHTPALARKFAAQQDPVRRRLFGDQPAGQGLDAPVQQGLGPQGLDDPIQNGRPLPPIANGGAQIAAPRPPQSPLSKAATYINSALTQDEAYPELDAYCRQVSSEYDMPSFDSAWAPFAESQVYEIPQRVFEQYNTAEVSTMMGLFGELNYAWVTVDNSLYLWDYTHPNPELIGYEDNPHSITAVKLVAPKPGVFVKEINYMLVVSTVQEMFLLGVAADIQPNGASNVTLYQTKMTLPLRGTEARVIAAAANGRIFYSGQSEPDIYELYYQQEEKWFSSRTGKINHSSPGWTSVVPRPPSVIWGSKSQEYIVDIVIDDTRNLLYSLSSSSTIRTYHMEGADRLTKVIEKTKNDCLRDVSHMLTSHSPLLSDRMDIIAISPIASTEDAKVHLMAVTNTGCRLYLSATSNTYVSSGSAASAPQSMQLQSIKFPPPTQNRQARPRDPYGGPSDYIDISSQSLALTRKAIRYAPGYFIAFVHKENMGENDVVFASAPDTGRIKNTSHIQNLRNYEQANWIEINSKAEDIGLISKPFAATNQPLGFGNELAVQFDTPTSEFAILTNTGVIVIRRRRLVDIFSASIRTTAGDEGLKDQFNKFQSLYGRVESVTAALAVACGQGSADQRMGAGRSAIDQAIEDRARQAFVNFGGNPMLPEQDGQAPTVESVRPSSRHAALSLYLSRLIRSLWTSPVISLGTDAAGALAIKSTVPNAKLATVQEHLERLRSFLDANRGLIQGLSGPSDLARAGSKAEEVAFQGEHQAMHALQILMAGISEGISFVLMLFDERVTDIYTRLDEASRQQLRELTFERLFSQTAGKDLAKVLVKAIVNRNIESGANVETVADALRRRCGSFCSPDDVVIFRAQEQLKRASDAALNPNTSRTLLAESLRLFQKVAGSLGPANLDNIVTQYIGLRYFAGAIQLCLTVAQEKDRGNTALSWFNDNKPANDPRERAFLERKDCYELIQHVLQNLDAASSMEPEMVDGKKTLIATKRDEAYEVVNGAPDEVFHFDLYDWYVQQGWTERLLNVESPHVVTFLQRLAVSEFRHAELLCRYYTARARYFEAAKVQADLAQSEFPISIKDRLNLLSLAKTNASVTTPGVSRQDMQMLHHTVTELLEVAHIQDTLLERLQNDPRISAERIPEVTQALDGPIQGLSELFNEYADQAEYHDLALLIFHAADFRNATTIQQTWSALIERTHNEVAVQWEAFHAARNARGTVPEPPPQPYERIIGVIREVCHRASNDSFIFPVPQLLPDLCRYAVDNAQDGRMNADPNWPIMVFLGLGVSHDLVTRCLERMFESQEIPFRGAMLSRVVEWIVYSVRVWMRELARTGRPEQNLPEWVGILVSECDVWIRTARGNNEGGMEMPELMRQVRDLKRSIDGAIGFGGSFRASMGFL
ncbi:uncharacterized protein PG998_003921 [Apiospora kogelbergensis]|uniref:Nucleoporin n=1 Tax=Apiospora kogelbergensis TaxID=1337665 RepID=A0AAW0QJX7_9PEZI